MKNLLSIALLTINRKEKIINALNSCFKCKLPEDTEFIIIDNGSADGTEIEVKKLFNDKPYRLIYNYNKENAGVGEGRNQAYKLSGCKYLYFLDDDAEIDFEKNDNFFNELIDYLDKNTVVAMVTTNIYDEMLIKDRKPVTSKNSIGGHFLAYAGQGGSFIVRRSVFSDYFHPDIKYAYEDIYPSIIALDKGYYNVYNKELNVLHKPAVNRWTKKDDLSIGIIERGNAHLYALRAILYPTIFKPLLFCAFICRNFKHLRKVKGSYKRSHDLYKQAIKDNTKYAYKIKIKTVLKIMKNFGIGATF